ncbi:protein of unknown function (plasmid) [Caballeronia sp. S22]
MRTEIQMIDRIVSKSLRNMIDQNGDSAVTGPVFVRSDLPDGPVVLTPTRHYYRQGRLLAYEIANAHAFWISLRQAKAEHGDRGATVSLPAVEYFRNRRLFVSHDGMAVFALGKRRTRAGISPVCANRRST